MKWIKLAQFALYGIVLVAAIVFVGVWFFKSGAPMPKDIQNVILISIDTCRADYLSCYGYPQDTTPHLDALAEEGFLFENAVSPVPLTLPAHSSMLTGRIPPVHGVHDNNRYKLGPSNLTLAEILQQNEFKTGAIISTGIMASKFGLNQGFDDYDDRFERKFSAVGIYERKGGEASRLAMEWLEKQKGERFFLFLHYYDPHQAYEPPEPFASKYQNNLYAGEIAYADYCIGKVVAKLKDLDLYDSTLIVVTGDHGEMLGEHGEDTHGYFIYQSALTVPLIFKLPGIDHGKRVRDPVGLVDILPTVCALLHLNVPGQIQGKDLSEYFLAKGGLGKDRVLYCESLTATKYNANSLLGVVTGRWKYIQTTRPELYDIVEDPNESINRIGQQPQMARVLQQGLGQALQQAGPKGGGHSKAPLDEADKRRLESLGYIAGTGVIEDFEFDQTKDDPKDLIGFYDRDVLASMYLIQKRYDQAKMIGKHMLQERPQYVGAYLVLARIATEQGNFAEAVSYLSQASGLQSGEGSRNDPVFADVHDDLGNALVFMGRFDAAIGHFSEALRINPDDAKARNNLGNALKNQGRIDEAMEQYTWALRINPNSVETHNNLGIALMEQGRMAEAMGQYAEALRIDPHSVETHNNLGNALKNQGRMDEAMAQYTEALRIKPKSVETHNNLGLVLMEAGRVSEALDHYSEALRLNPESAEVHHNLGAAMVRKGMMAEAVSHFQKAVQINPHFVGARDSLNKVLAAQAQLDEGISRLQKALRRNPSDADLHFRLGDLYQRSGKTEEAMGQYQKALTLEPTFVRALNNLGILYAMRGDHGEAISLFKRVIGILPNSANTYYNIACLYAKQERVDEAIHWLKQAIDRGYDNWALIRTDRDLERIRSSPYYESLMAGRE